MMPLGVAQEERRHPYGLARHCATEEPSDGLMKLPDECRPFTSRCRWRSWFRESDVKINLFG